ncbi:MAG: YgeY family selenium metabolism-linked hydrolase [Clostridia bacterium]|nr:YgeY family selenium metabolism-linked hydrolase [Clostridia bacterium]
MKFERDEELIAFTQRLIRCRSYSGEEEGVVQILSEKFKEIGAEITIDRYGDIIACVKGDRHGPTILFDGHIDTVPVPDPSVWSHDPFGGEIADGKLYGRGTSDMKGADAAMAIAILRYVQAHGRDFPGEICFAGVVHEECFEGVASREISRIVKPDFVVIGEASEMNLKIGQRGRAEIKVETYGKSAHSSNPEKGINAVYKMVRLIERLRAVPVPEYPGLAKGNMELTDIVSVPYPGASVLPSLCSVTYDRRLLPKETPGSVLKPVLDIIGQMEAEDPEFKAKAYFTAGEERCYTGEPIADTRFFPGWKYDASEPYVQKVKQRLDEIGICPELTAYNFCTNGSHYAGEAGIRTMGFGPSREDLAHTVDEYVEVDQLVAAMHGYIGIMEALLEEDDR